VWMQGNDSQKKCHCWFEDEEEMLIGGKHRRNGAVTNQSAQLRTAIGMWNSAEGSIVG